jgi:hypothetical protein
MRIAHRRRARPFILRMWLGCHPTHRFTTHKHIRLPPRQSNYSWCLHRITSQRRIGLNLQHWKLRMRCRQLTISMGRRRKHPLRCYRRNQRLWKFVRSWIRSISRSQERKKGKGQELLMQQCSRIWIRTHMCYHHCQRLSFKCDYLNSILRLYEILCD